VAAGFSGDPDFARLYAELTDLIAALIEAVGPGRIDGAYDKVIQAAAQPEFPLDLLPPYRAATRSSADRYRDVLRTRYPHWLAA
jgi:hypothetical protein